MASQHGRDLADQPTNCGSMQTTSGSSDSGGALGDSHGTQTGRGLNMTPPLSGAEKSRGIRLAAADEWYPSGEPRGFDDAEDSLGFDELPSLFEELEDTGLSAEEAEALGLTKKALRGTLLGSTKRGWKQETALPLEAPKKSRPSGPTGAGTNVGAPRRRDLQVIAPKARGDAKVALATAEGPEELRMAINELQRTKVAPTTTGPKRSRETLVFEILSKAGLGSPTPVTLQKVRTVAAVLKRGKYRSAALYLSALKGLHLRAGLQYFDYLMAEQADCVRSCLRGLGVPTRAPEVRLAWAVRASAQWKPITDGGPVNPRTAWFVALWWMLREIELAGLSLHASCVSVGEKTATLRLPTSKVDQMGKGAERTWSCLCKTGALVDGAVDPAADDCCPVCLLRDHVQKVEQTYGVLQTDDESADIPLFPTSEGKTPAKHDVVKSWTALFEGVGEDEGLDEAEEDPASGRLLYEGVDGHSARRSAAKLFTRLGWTKTKVQFAGRWGSDAVLNYIEEVAELGDREFNLDADKVQPPGDGDGQSVAQSVAGALLALEERLETFEGKVEKAYMTKEEMMEVLQAETALKPSYMRKDKVHRVATTLGKRRYWETCCGWKFGLSSDIVLTTEKPDHGPFCTRLGCFPVSP